MPDRLSITRQDDRPPPRRAIAARKPAGRMPEHVRSAATMQIIPPPSVENAKDRMRVIIIASTVSNLRTSVDRIGTLRSLAPGVARRHMRRWTLESRIRSDRAGERGDDGYPSMRMAS